MAQRKYDQALKDQAIEAVVKHGRIITPTDHTWDDWFDQNNTTDDFMNERLQEADQVRESLLLSICSIRTS